MLQNRLFNRVYAKKYLAASIHYQSFFGTWIIINSGRIPKIQFRYELFYNQIYYVENSLA